MAEHFVERWPQSGVKRHQLLEKVLELVGVDVLAVFLNFGVRSPEALGVCHQVVVVRIAGVGLFEGDPSGEKREQNDSGGKQVDRLSVVCFTKVDLGGHVASSPELSR